MNKYILGFNHGYIIMKEDSSLLDFVKDFDKKGDYLRGLNDGKLYADREQLKSISDNSLKNTEAEK